MRFSLVVPVYNCPEYLPVCMESILKNDCSDCEIILVDDGSADGVTPALCDSIAKENPELIRVIHQTNRGPGGARNTGLEAARGEYLFFVDSDDTIAPDSLQILSAAVDRQHADIYTFQMASHEPGGAKTPVKIAEAVREPVSLSEHPELLLAQPAIWARIWRRDLFLNTGIRFPDKVWIGEDLRTVTKLMAVAATQIVLPDTLYFYLIRPGSIMRSENANRNRDIIRAFEDVVGWFREHGLFQQYRKELCYLAVDHVLLAATVRVVLADPRSMVLREFLQFTQSHFPDYRKNPYVQQMSRMRRFAMRLVENRRYRLLRLLFLIRGSV